LAEEGFPRLPRRSRLKVGLTVKGVQVPARAEPVTIGDVTGSRFESETAGVFLFAPFLDKLGIEEIVRAARLPATKTIPALNYVLPFLALKLMGTERYAHVSDHAFDAGVGLFTGVNVLPKCAAISSYSYSLDEVNLVRLQRAFVKQGVRLGLYDGRIINLDFHTVPHYGEESVLENHWTATRGKRMKGALTLFAKDASSLKPRFTTGEPVKFPPQPARARDPVKQSCG
jgi:hypothetical protein